MCTSCIGCMGFRSVGRVLFFHVSGASTLCVEASGTKGTCKDWKWRTQGIGMILT